MSDEHRSLSSAVPDELHNLLLTEINDDMLAERWRPVMAHSDEDIASPPLQPISVPSAELTQRQESSHRDCRFRVPAALAGGRAARGASASAARWWRLGPQRS